MGYLGLIFDFNGVLLWDSALHERAWATFAQGLREAPFTVAEMARYMHGRSNHKVVEYLIGHSLPYAEGYELGLQKEAIYRELCLALGADFHLSPGATELLDKLVAHEVPRTIATASEITNVTFFSEKLQLGRWFDLPLIVHDTGEFPMKPAPDIYLRAATNLGLAPADCVVVEDSHSGIQAAHAAGIGHIVALGPANVHEQLAAVPGVKRVITRLSELPVQALFLEGVRHE